MSSPSVYAKSFKPLDGKEPLICFGSETTKHFGIQIRFRDTCQYRRMDYGLRPLNIASINRRPGAHHDVDCGLNLNLRDRANRETGLKKNALACSERKPKSAGIWPECSSRTPKPHW